MTLLVRAELEKWIAENMRLDNDADAGALEYSIDVGSLQRAIQSNAFTAQAGDGVLTELRELYQRLEENERARLTNNNYLLSAELKSEQLILLCTIAGHAKILLDTRTPSTGMAGDGWIPVSESTMPNRHQPVALLDINRYQNCHFELNVHDVGYLEGVAPRLYWSIRGERAQELRAYTHWYPLPQPPSRAGVEGE